MRKILEYRIPQFGTNYMSIPKGGMVLGVAFKDIPGEIRRLTLFIDADDSKDTEERIFVGVRPTEDILGNVHKHLGTTTIFNHNGEKDWLVHVYEEMKNERSASLRYIRKFQPFQTGNNLIKMPKGATLISATIYNGDLMVWAETDPDVDNVDRSIYVVSGGDAVPPGMSEFIGTAVSSDGKKVFHVYDLGEDT